MNKDALPKLIKFVEQKLDRGKCENWTNGDFEILSAEIRRATKVSISAATLKRIFGKVSVSEGYSPQRATLDALMQYADFEAKEQAATTVSQKRRLHYRWLVGVASIFAILLIGWQMWMNSSNEPAFQPQGTITLQSLEGTCPSTAFFRLALDSISGYRVTFDDESKPLAIPPVAEFSFPHFYAYPGYFTPKLWHDNRIVATGEPVLVETEGWQAFASLYKDSEPRTRFHPIRISDNVTDGEFFISKPHLSQAGLDTTKILVVQLDHYSPMHVSADEFVYQTRIKNDEFWPGLRCYSMHLRIQGTEGKVEFKLVGEGCSGFSEATIGKHKVTDKVRLQSLALDVSEWNDIQISHLANRVELLVNDRLLFEGKTLESLGELIGTSLIFHGSGKVDFVKLSVGGKKRLESPF
ncbi:hypothetical protein [Pontibacter sp. G13]|uniref:hypothetical protein n=1 Tax=Pontibacter sp. G13 TaxID=3074898 RepID=UPI0028891D96|nr:hypothetical protein [Pontibacter sp. G13]WNJ16572.1 hypothetical protein RJD25_17030 [Pontibacter sp. G13]